jgi:hypothetical protein
MRKGITDPSQNLKLTTMQNKYDFSGAERGKFYQAPSQEFVVT